MKGRLYVHKARTPEPPSVAPLIGAVATASIEAWRSISGTPPCSGSGSHAGGLHLSLVTVAETVKTWICGTGLALWREEFSNEKDKDLRPEPDPADKP